MLLVKDLGSANGTFVNGKKIKGQQVLEAGDEIDRRRRETAGGEDR